MDEKIPFETCVKTFNALAPLALANTLKRYLCKTYVRPVILCVGSDRVAGDSLGPMTGTLLEESKLPLFLYGTLRSPVTAREVRYMKGYLAKTHPLAPVLAVDAAVGEREEVGLIKVIASPLLPGSGSNKQLGEVGDLSILGITAPREGMSALENVRLGSVYAMAQAISEGIKLALENNAMRAGSLNRKMRRSLKVMSKKW